MYDAITSLAFNYGPNSEVIDNIILYINSKNYHIAKMYIKTLSINKDRRKKEAELFSSEGIKCDNFVSDIGTAGFVDKAVELGSQGLEYIMNTGEDIYDYFVGEDDQEKEKGTK